MSSLLRQIQTFITRHGATILTCVGGAGMIATTVTAVNATPKAMKLITAAEEQKGKNLTKLETVKATGRVYIPSIGMGLGTLACIFGANMLNKRSQMSIASAYILLANSYKKYRHKIQELYGEYADEDAREEIAKDKQIGNIVETHGDTQLFFEEFSGRYFESTIVKVLMAESEIKRRLATSKCAYLNEFYALLDIPETDYGNWLGWTGVDQYEMPQKSRLEFQNDKMIMDDGLECYIVSMSIEPTFGFNDY